MNTHFDCPLCSATQWVHDASAKDYSNIFFKASMALAMVSNSLRGQLAHALLHPCARFLEYGIQQVIASLGQCQIHIAAVVRALDTRQQAPFSPTHPPPG
jgi:hypothetical protein